MGLKEAFIPDWKKIVLALIILFVLFLIPMEKTTVDYMKSSRGLPFVFIRAGTANVPLPPGMPAKLSAEFTLWAFAADLLICYAAASMIIFALAKRKRI